MELDRFRSPVGFFFAHTLVFLKLVVAEIYFAFNVGVLCCHAEFIKASVSDVMLRWAYSNNRTKERIADKGGYTNPRIIYLCFSKNKK